MVPQQSHQFTLRYCLPSYLPNAFVAIGFSRAYPGKRNAASRTFEVGEGNGWFFKHDAIFVHS
jgi:hypothetical protein